MKIDKMDIINAAKQNEPLDNPAIQFQENSSIIISGSSKSGKTYWINTFLKHLDQMFEGQPPVEVLYFYLHHQPLYDEMKKNLGDRIIFKEGMPKLDDILDFAKDDNHRLIVLDDVMHLIVDDANISLLFTQLVHHKKLSCLIVYQNLFTSGRYARTISLNASYLVLFNNIRDKSQVSVLGRQIFPGKSRAFMDAYCDAVGEPYSYLVIDMTPTTPDQYRLRNKIFPNELMMKFEI